MPIRNALLVSLLATLLAVAAPASFAQDADQRPIEQRMSAEEFAAAGLGKLTPAELAALNDWLRGTLEVETERAAAVAAEAAAEKVKDDNRGFFHFGSDEPIVAHLQGHFDGFARNRRYTLDNGQVWKQTDSARLEGVERDNPEVTISPGMFGNVWYLQVEGYNKRAKVERVE
ncbi:MAG TPA: hypothetical protein VFM73_04855 [Xanthomonadaceae bacterium]|nr:hypothetical protein [Xanthomonadaceae bacterium]